jgi:hypothetical protein
MFESEKAQLALQSVDLSRWTHNLLENVENHIKTLTEELKKVQTENAALKIKYQPEDPNPKQ